MADSSEDLTSSLVYYYLLQTDEHIAGLFKDCVEVIPLQKGSPAIVDVVRHYETTAPVSKRKRFSLLPSSTTDTRTEKKGKSTTKIDEEGTINLKQEEAANERSKESVQLKGQIGYAKSFKETIAMLESLISGDLSCVEMNITNMQRSTTRRSRKLIKKIEREKNVVFKRTSEMRGNDRILVITLMDAKSAELLKYAHRLYNRLSEADRLISMSQTLLSDEITKTEKLKLGAVLPDLIDKWREGNQMPDMPQQVAEEIVKRNGISIIELPPGFERFRMNWGVPDKLKSTDLSSFSGKPNPPLTGAILKL